MRKLHEYLLNNRETQKSFADRTGMTQGNVAKLCGPSPKLSIATAVEIERATGGAVPVEAWPQFKALSSRHISSSSVSVPRSEAV